MENLSWKILKNVLIQSSALGSWTNSVFSLTFPASMQIYWNKRKRLQEFNSHRTGLGNKHGRRFIVLGHKYGRCDLMWKHNL